MRYEEARRDFRLVLDGKLRMTDIRNEYGTRCIDVIAAQEFGDFSIGAVVIWRYLDNETTVAQGGQNEML